jgi:hypothetical protein
VGTDGNLGDPSGGLILDGGELVATGRGFSTLRSVLLTANNGTLAAAVGGLADFRGNITGVGSLTVGDGVNTGTVSLSGTNTYLGNTTIVSGATLQTLSTGALSATSAAISNKGRERFMTAWPSSSDLSSQLRSVRVGPFCELGVSSPRCLTETGARNLTAVRQKGSPETGDHSRSKQAKLVCIHPNLKTYPGD